MGASESTSEVLKSPMEVNARRFGTAKRKDFMHRWNYGTLENLPVPLLIWPTLQGERPQSKPQAVHEREAGLFVSIPFARAHSGGGRQKGKTVIHLPLVDTWITTQEHTSCVHLAKENRWFLFFSDEKGCS